MKQQLFLLCVVKNCCVAGHEPLKQDHNAESAATAACCCCCCCTLAAPNRTNQH
jgi:hypothetical protein